jgi:hypothetical protein
MTRLITQKHCIKITKPLQKQIDAVMINVSKLKGVLKALKKGKNIKSIEWSI